MKNIEPLVKDILKEIPVTRGSDKELMIRIWQHQGLNLTTEQVYTFRTVCHSPETCRRTRQKIQHDGLYLPDEKTQKMRKQKAQEMHDQFAKPKYTLINKNGENVYIVSS